MDLAVRFAVMLGSRILVPAASFYETEVAPKVLRRFLESDIGDVFRFVGSGSSLAEFSFEKIEQYRPGSPQHAIYSASPEQLVGWEQRTRSATKDIATGWREQIRSEGVLQDFRRKRPEAMTDKEFERAWIDVPERLGQEAFIVPHVLERLPVDPRNISTQNRLHRIVNREYFASYAKDFGASVFQNMSALGGDVVPSGCEEDDIDYGSLVKVCRVSGILERIRGCPVQQLESLCFEPAFQEAFAMSQTGGYAHSSGGRSPDPMRVDLAILTALPKEREAVEAVFGTGRPFRVSGDPHMYKMIDIEIQGTAKKVVVAVLSEMGNVRAGVTGTDLLRSLSPAIVLMVGIAGGCPNPSKPAEHVRLGDVVLGSSVLEYDHIRRRPGGVAQFRDSPQRLSYTISQAAAALRSERTGFDIGWIAPRDQALRHFGIDPGALPPDVLHGIDGVEIQHPPDPRRTLSPSIVHYGRIGAGDTLLKDPAFRDQLRDQHSVMAVEMEGAGIRDAAWSRSCEVGVVRGIVDYCDDYKSDDWHLIAAVSAAAVARLLFETLVQADS
ncbi:5'-methylthioadenosine/S-adenosylhomocysteine nucleosidase [Mesorhizobium sophorae]|uniref:5'-methylthioadenosine/S-adenosylhomocysteine nucleosidase family protein n=1 Tax=Mesorhizobium sophorae TaxID=1300294 RepID=UPI00142DA93E|nr:5'-methylthioadenosine/S-adenosylhomocysteine nucleosidase [Mesorhizobium sophorae]